MTETVTTPEEATHAETDAKPEVAIENAVATTKVCTCCGECKPIDRFSRLRSGTDVRRSECTQCRVRKNRITRNGAERKELRDSMREMRRSKFGRMRAILDNLVNRFGGPNALAERLYQSYVDGSESHRRRTVETLLTLDAAITRQQAAEQELLARKIKAGMASGEDIAEALEQLGEEQMLDAACEPVRVLVETELLGEVLKRLRERGALGGEQLEDVRREVH